MTSKAHETIIVCEPCYWGIHHATFNAALIGLIGESFPHAEIIFLGESGHVDFVKPIVAERLKKLLPRIRWRKKDLPLRLNAVGRLKQIKSLFLYYFHIRGIAVRSRTDKLFFCSIDKPGIAVLRLLLLFIPKNAVSIMFTHDLIRKLMIESQLSSDGMGIIEKLKRHESVLRIFNSRRFRFVTFNHALIPHVKKEYGWINNFYSMNPPYIWFNDAVDVAKKIEDADYSKIIFGFFGSEYKGIEIFYRLAAEISQKYKNVEFHHIGYVGWKNTNCYGNNSVKGGGVTPLSNEEYVARGEKIHFSIFSMSDDYAKGRISASFIDSISFVKPVIALKNAYVSYWFNEMGNIGYLCGSYGEMYHVISSLLNNFSVDNYLIQMRNILNQRKRFEPSYLCCHLRNIS